MLVATKRTFSGLTEKKIMHFQVQRHLLSKPGDHAISLGDIGKRQIGYGIKVTLVLDQRIF